MKRKNKFSPSELGMEDHEALDFDSIKTDAAELPSPEDTVTQAAFIREEIFENAKANMDVLAALAMPLVFQYFFPPIFKAVWQWLLSFVDTARTFPKLALGLPRGFGKSTVVKLFLLYVILFTRRNFILTFGATATKAEAIIADIIAMLDEPNIIAIFGDWKIGCTKDTQTLKIFSFRGREIILAALGKGGSVRGLNLGHKRPDVMVFDDIQEREEADSEKVSLDIETWMLGTAMKAKSPFGCMYLFIANMYPTQWSLLRRLKKNKEWIKFITGGIQEDGTSLWEELQPISQLISEYESDLEAGHPEIFHAEVLNDENASLNNIIDISKLPPNPYTDKDIHEGHFIVIDPGGRKKKSDATTITYFRVFNSMPEGYETEEGVMSPLDTITKAVTMALNHGCTFIVIESNAYQESLNFWFEWLCQQRGIEGIRTAPIYSGRDSKNSRILSMLKAYQKGQIWCADAVRSAFHSQIVSFNPSREDNTDGLLDTFTYAPRVIAEFPEEIRVMTYISESEYSQHRIWDETENSCI